METTSEQTHRATTGSVPTKPILSAYTDFRQYLRDFYHYKQFETRHELRPYSYATFSAGADIRSPNYLKLIIEGQRNLSAQMAKKFAKALGFSKEQTEEFLALVNYGQAKDPLERNRYLKRLAEFRVNQKIKSGEIKEEAWSKVPSWVTWVIYAMADQEGVTFDVESLRKHMKGRASLDEIKKSLERLLTSKELIKDKSTGEIKKGRELISGHDEIPVALVRKLQAELTLLGLESLIQDEPTDREFGAITIALTEQEFEHLKFELRQLRKRLFKDFSVQRAQSKGDRVFQLNLQLFPVTE